jgi:hypothetical protein
LNAGLLFVSDEIILTEDMSSGPLLDLNNNHQCIQVRKGIKQNGGTKIMISLSVVLEEIRMDKGATLNEIWTSGRGDEEAATNKICGPYLGEDIGGNVTTFI